MLANCSWQKVDEWMRLYGDRIIRVVYLIIDDYHVAEEITQEVFVRAFKSMNSFRGDSSAYTWLYRIALNLSRNHLNRKSKISFRPLKIEEKEDVLTESPEEKMVRKDLSRKIRDSIMQLSLIYREVIILHYFEDLKVSEIAQVLQQPEGTVKSKLSRGREALEKTYYDQLLQIKRDKFLVEEAAGANVQAGNHRIAIELYKEIEDEMSKSIFWFHRMGELYFKTGEVEKALDNYQAYLNKEKEFRDLGPVIASLYHDDVIGAIKLLKENSYSERARYNSNGETEKPADINLRISNLESYHSGTKSVLSRNDFRKYLLEIINIDGSNRFEKVSAFQSKIESLGDKDVLVIVLSKLAKDRR